MSTLLDWLAANESAFSAIAAIIAIVAGIAVTIRFTWSRMPDKGLGNIKRPAFLSDWRNIALISLATLALLLMGLLALGPEPEVIDTSATDDGLSGKPSVAVLPLNYISKDQSDAYLADGIAEDVITLLSYNPRFFVIARNSSFTYHGQSVDVRQVGEELGVRYVVEGSVQKIGERLRVTVQLIDTSTGKHLWAEKYDRAYVDLFALQDEITNGIAAALGEKIFTAEIARASRVPTDNLDAWSLVMRANKSLTNNNRHTVDAAIKDLRAALEIDPDYALAKAELAFNHCLKVASGFSDDPKADIAQAYRLSGEALTAEPDHPLVIARAGACYGYTGRREDGIRLLQKALVVQPNNAFALWHLGTVLVLDGQSEAALATLEQAIRMSPKAPVMYIIKSFQAVALSSLKRYAEAEQAALAGLQFYDGWQGSWRVLATARAGLGDIKGAQAALYKAREKEPDFSLESTKRAYALVYKDKGRLSLSLLEPIWPEDLKTADHGSGK